MDYSKFKIFLSALEHGLELQVGDQVYAMGFDSKDRPRISHKLTSTDSEGNEKPVYMQGLILPEINNFILEIMDKITDEDIAEIAATVAFNKVKKEKYGK